MYFLTTLGALRLRRVDANGRLTDALRLGAQPKAVAVLVYLAVRSPEWCRRDDLLALFWPDTDESRARNALSRMLSRIRAELGPGIVRTRGAHELGIAPAVLESDVDRFRQAITDAAWARAFDLHEGEFLHGFHLPGVHNFDGWVEATRMELLRHAVDAGMHLADQQVARGDTRAAAVTLRRALRIVPTDEPVARRLMQVLGEGGDRAGALSVYAALEEALMRDIGVAPSEAARAQAEGIRASAAIRSLAVLPWINLTGEPEQDHVTDGFTDVLITEVALAHSGRVISRQSSLQLKGTDLTLRRIGALLGVDAAIEGSLARFGDRVTVTAQLLRIDPETHLWARRIETTVEELPFVASTIAREVAATLDRPRAEAAQADTSALQAHAPIAQADPRSEKHASAGIPAAAYEAFLRGRHFSGSLLDLEKAMACYMEAVTLAPSHAPSWAGLAAIYALLTLFAVRSPAELFPAFLRAAQRAIELDPRLGEAHTSMGLYRMLADRDWQRAEQSLRRGASLAVGEARPHAHLALYLGAMGRFQEAMTEIALALDLDPIGPDARFTNAWLLYKAGRHAESNQVLQQLLELHPHFVLAITYRALNCALMNRTEEVLRDACLAMEAAPDSHEVLALGVAALGQAGHVAAAQEPLAQLLDMEQQRYVDPWAVSVSFAGLGRHEEALRWLRRMYDERSPSAFCIRCDPMLDPLRQEPRFIDLYRRLGFPPAAQPRSPPDPSRRG